ncbi:hypothetical protein TWF694_003026 [Orbilia ellipsospora]|uniref:PNPLA domain-containing protein n=1 Tax=Orbilia ellipsospora TaxID=2528407 RepID=A0AAV9X0J0_9PEZI
MSVGYITARIWIAKLKSQAIENGRYKVKAAQEVHDNADENPAITRSTVWFKSPALDPVTIRRLDHIQLYAESHDQGFCDNPDLGNWTWFELAIYEDDQAEFPRSKGGVDLIWRSHYNAFSTNEFKWCEGELFEEKHDLIRCLEDGNVIGVRLCSRFSGWKIHARNGYLVFKIGSETLNRPPPPKYSKMVTNLNVIQDVLNEVNVKSEAVFKPSISEGLYRADAFSTAEEPPLRVLALDGGGVRGLMSLKILKAVFEHGNITKKPCEVFDMIGGTSTGGFIAIMLGRLRMSIDECIQRYEKVMGKVFPDGTWKTSSLVWNGHIYPEGPLEEAIKEIVKEKLGSADAKLIDDSENACKIFVMAVREDKGNNRAPVFFRSYVNRENASEFPEVKIWEAARATSAAPSYFKPFKLGDHNLVDGGLGANNPIGWLWTEMLAVFGPARPTNCFLSIGTGRAKNQSLPEPGKLLKAKHTLEALASIATNTEITHILFRTLINAFAPKTIAKKYWRLNFGKHIGDWDEKGGIWEGWATERHYDDWKDPGGLDDVKALEALEPIVKKCIADMESDFKECGAALQN